MTSSLRALRLPALSIGRVAGRFFAALFLACTAVAAPAQQSSQPIKLVVPLPPAGGTDFWARLTAERMSASLGQRVIIENRPGAGTMIGAQYVARAAPDGHTALVGAVGTFSLNPHLYSKMPYDVFKDFVPVTMTVRHSLMLVVPQASNLKSVSDFVAAARAEPNRLSYGSPATASPHHLAMEVIAEAVGIKLTHVPFKGGAPLALALASGQVDAAFVDIPSALPHLKSGRIRPLAVFTTARFSTFPDVPTIAESGVNATVVDAWQGMVVPANTPPDVIERLNSAYRTAAQDPEFIRQLNEMGILLSPSTPEEFWRFVKQESDRWKAFIQARKITVD